MTKQNKIKDIIIKAFDIWFADGKDTVTRVLSLFSALFWTWLEFSFFIFFFTYAFGMYYALLGNYPAAIELIKNNKQFIDAIVKMIVLLIFIMRVPIHYKKEIKKRK